MKQLYIKIALLSILNLKQKLMQEAHAAGCHSTAEADRYHEQKRKRETEENGSRKESRQDGGISSRDILNSSIPSADLTNTYSSQRITYQPNRGSFTDLDPMDCPAAEFLSAPVSIISSFV